MDKIEEQQKLNESVGYQSDNDSDNDRDGYYKPYNSVDDWNKIIY